MSESEPIARILDARDLRCPEPVMLLHKEMRGLASGQLLAVHATDPSTERDIPKFCQFLGHTLVVAERRGDEEFYYLLRKK